MNRFRFWILTGLVIFLGAAIMAYKVFILGYSLSPNSPRDIWDIDAHISFLAVGEPVKVQLFVPTYLSNVLKDPDKKFMPNYGFFEITTGNKKLATWEIQTDTGRRDLYYRIRVQNLKLLAEQVLKDPEYLAPGKFSEEAPFWDKTAEVQVKNIIEFARLRSVSNTSMASQIIQRMSLQKEEANRLFYKKNASEKDKILVLMKIFDTAKISSRIISGFLISKDNKHQPISYLLQVYDEKNGWITLNIEKGMGEFPENFVIWRIGDSSLLEVEGGKNSNLSFSVIKQTIPEKVLIQELSEENKNSLLTFSLYSLPVKEQNAFRILLLIPIATLVVSLFRVFVGMPTSGTFMPILIALSLRETEVLLGIVLFVIIISAGLVLRSYLSEMSLLLVPRISAVVVLVVLLMTIIAVIGFKLGLSDGLRVTYFPMIIMAWTIERMSIVWEEQGAKSAISQTAGALIIAVSAYFVMYSQTSQYITFTFPESMLIILGLLMMIGSYSGYRLSELKRFAPFAKGEY